MYNDVFIQQRESGVIEKITNLTEFMQDHPECSFLPHMGVFRMQHESTKCRVVFLSNLAEKNVDGTAVSHNKAILPGPNLNHKITTAVLMNRFDKLLVTFDIKKAFLNIRLPERDQNRLLFLWFNNAEKNDFSVVAYRNLRLSFGLRCSPAILMLALYRILMQDNTGESKLDSLKKKLYNTIYMDNGSYSCNSEEELKEAIPLITKIFEEYKMELQQFYTNSPNVQSVIDAGIDTETPSDVKFFGMNWDRENDVLSVSKINFDCEANTKRLILRNINSVYDVYNMYAPVLLRAKVFMQKLQLTKNRGWDDILPVEEQHEWRLIAKQANACPPAEMPRFIGERSGQFELVAFTDASKDAYGVVIYIRDTLNNKVSYLAAKNKLINSAESTKTMPQLEMLGIAFGVETLFDYYNSLCGETVVIPVDITAMRLFTDSLVCLHWLQSYSVHFDKMQKVSVFVKNRLQSIDHLCQKFPVKFQHVSGEDNPADKVSRHCSHKVLARSNYYTGPTFLCERSDCDEFTITVPNPNCKPVDEVILQVAEMQVQSASPEDRNTPRQTAGDLISVGRYSSFSKHVAVLANVLRFINCLKLKVKEKNERSIVDCFAKDANFRSIASNKIISCEQYKYYADIFAYLDSRTKNLKDLPELLGKLNLFKDENGILRVKSKFHNDRAINPILLPKSSQLTISIIRNIHEKLGHSGVYSVLRELRREFWITSYFSAVKFVLKQCVECRRIHERPIKLNQNEYRDFRSNPPRSVYSYIALDYIGPFILKLEGKRKKVWLLAITCLYTRAINLKICRSANVDDFLRGVQLHVFEYGVFQFCISDLGSQIQAGANVIETFLNDFETVKYFEENNIKPMSFQHYAKGNSALGSLIETLVKQVKYLIFKSIKTAILDYFEFELLIEKAINLINKRPIAFKESLRTLPVDEVPTPITPELLVRGYECVSVNVIPSLQHRDEDPDFGEEFDQKYEKLRKARENLINVYHEEFLANLIYQAVDKKGRYSPVSHKCLKPGDIVLLVEKLLKNYHYPMGRVERVETNSLGEVTAAYVFKGSTRERVYRHVTSLILLIPGESILEQQQSDYVENSIAERREPSSRKAAKVCKRKIKLMQERHDV